MDSDQTDPTRLWTVRLSKEYDHILFTYRIKLRRPVIRLFDSQSRWGEWDAETRILSLSRHLIERYPWEVVIEILKHEIAHQMVSEWYREEDGHGKFFREAAERLGLASWAMRAEAESQDLDLIRKSASDQEEDRILSRIQKLLALAGSTNEHESALAMKKVQELYLRYNLERLGLERLADLEGKINRKLTYLTLPLRRRRVERFQSAIASILHDFFFVEVIHSSLYDARDNVEYKTIELLGTNEAIKMSEHVYWFLERHLRDLWGAYRKKTGKGLRSRNSFLMGVLAGLRSQLEVNASQSMAKLEQETQMAGKSLVPLAKQAKQELELYLAYRYPKTVRQGSRRALNDGHSYRAGENEGKKLRIHKPISESRQKVTHLLFR